VLETDQLAAGTISATELTTRTLAAIDASQPTINAFRLIRRTALAEAQHADQRLHAGERLPLLGVPVAVKDDQDITGDPTAYGCPGTFPPAAQDSDTVRLLRAAGAIIIGKTNEPELGQWPFTEGSAFGATRNPWHLGHSPGGSSGGSAAAVAAGLVPVAIGTDGAGSVRIPAAWTHLVGIKPGRPRTDDSRFGGVSIAGPLARTTADAALLLDILTEQDPGQSDSFHTAAHRPPRPLRVAISLRPPFTGFRPRLDPHIRAAITRLASALTELGHHVTTADPDYGVVGVNFLARSAGGLHAWAASLPDPSLLDDRTRKNMTSGHRVSVPLRRLIGPTSTWSQRQVGRIFRDIDVVVTPTTATGPPTIGQWQHLGIRALNRAVITACPYAWPWNALGWPAINIPAGLDPTGLPIGAQLLGPAHSEALLISLAAQLEAHQRWPERRPPPLA
jgi:amidase